MKLNGPIISMLHLNLSKIQKKVQSFDRLDYFKPFGLLSHHAANFDFTFFNVV